MPACLHSCRARSSGISGLFGACATIKRVRAPWARVAPLTASACCVHCAQLPGSPKTASLQQEPFPHKPHMGPWLGPGLGCERGGGEAINAHGRGLSQPVRHCGQQRQLVWEAPCKKQDCDGRAFLSVLCKPICLQKAASQAHDCIMATAHCVSFMYLQDVFGLGLQVG